MPIADHTERMIELLALIGLLTVGAGAVVAVVNLARWVARDGYGSTPVPRSHAAELGTWVDRQLRR
jgi:hypothetical protein